MKILGRRGARGPGHTRLHVHDGAALRPDAERLRACPDEQHRGPVLRRMRRCGRGTAERDTYRQIKAD